MVVEIWLCRSVPVAILNSKKNSKKSTGVRESGTWLYSDRLLCFLCLMACVSETRGTKDKAFPKGW